jgi:hypothetical protein
MYVRKYSKKVTWGRQEYLVMPRSTSLKSSMYERNAILAFPPKFQKGRSHHPFYPPSNYYPPLGHGPHTTTTEADGARRVRVRSEEAVGETRIRSKEAPTTTARTRTLRIRPRPARYVRIPTTIQDAVAVIPALKRSARAVTHCYRPLPYITR